MNAKKGVTLVETIVAMALVVIISIMAYTTISFSVAVTQNNKQKSFFASETQNFLKCYFMGQEKYEDSMKFLTNQDVLYDQNARIYYSNDFKISSMQDAFYYVDVKFESEKFVVESYKIADQKQIYRVEV